MTRLEGKLEPQVALMDLMKARDISYTDLDRIVGVTRSSVSLWARGLRRPTVEQAKAVCTALAARLQATPKNGGPMLTKILRVPTRTV